MISRTFDFVANWLFAMSKKIGVSYNEMNIIVYFIFIPITWLFMIDILIPTYGFLSVTYGLIWNIYLLKLKNPSRSADRLFNKSVDFLNYFNRFGSNYVASSVIICVILPIIIYAVLITSLVIEFS
jgi:hypothetical protein